MVADMEEKRQKRYCFKVQSHLNDTTKAVMEIRLCKCEIYVIFFFYSSEFEHK